MKLNHNQIEATIHIPVRLFLYFSSHLAFAAVFRVRVSLGGNGYLLEDKGGVFRLICGRRAFKRDFLLGSPRLQGVCYRETAVFRNVAYGMDANPISATAEQIVLLREFLGFTTCFVQ